MGRYTGHLLAVLLLVFGWNGSAKADPAFGTSHDALFVSATMETNDAGTPMALCLETRTTYFLFAPFYRTALGPALSPAVCSIETITPLTEAQIAQGLEGVRPWVMDKATRLSVEDRFNGFWGWFLVPLRLVPIWVWRAFRMQETAGRAVLLETMDPFTAALCRVLGLVAGPNGRLRRQELAQIRAVVMSRTGEDVSQEEVIELAQPADRPLVQIDISGLGDPLKSHQRIAVAEAMIEVVRDVEDPKVSAFIDRVYDELGLPRATDTTLLAGVHPAPEPAQ